jgi:hypothetical protein
MVGRTDGVELLGKVTKPIRGCLGSVRILELWVRTGKLEELL